jgi:hypothetical protein
MQREGQVGLLIVLFLLSTGVLSASNWMSLIMPYPDSQLVSKP